MRRARVLVGLAAVVVGIGLAVLPFWSTWNVTSEALSEVPAIDGAEVVSQDRRVGALFDDEFVLATRTYNGISDVEMRASLRAAGFEGYVGADADAWLWRTCCGSWDAVLARPIALSAETTRLELTMYDSDIQAAWAFFVFVGLLFAGTGAIVAYAGRRPSPAPTPEPLHL